MNNDQPPLREVLTVQEDSETGELFIQFPETFLKSVGWKEGDTIQWSNDSDGSWILSKKNV